jgi:transcriptional regulator with XRE-family HTH domain
MKKIGEIIKEARINKNLSQEELAQIIFVTKQSISKYENNKSIPGKEILKSIEDVLDINLIDDGNSSHVIIRKPVFHLILTITVIVLAFLSFISIHFYSEFRTYKDMVQDNYLNYNEIQISYLGIYSISISQNKIKIEINVHNSSDSNSYQLSSSLITINKLDVSSIKYFAIDTTNGMPMTTVSISPNSDYHGYLTIIFPENYIENLDSIKLYYSGQFVALVKF